MRTFRLGVRLDGADYWLLPLNSALHSAWTHHVHGNFRVLRYSASEKVLLVQKRRLLAERETDVDDNWLNTDYLLTCELQWHSESTIMMSRS